MSNPKTEISGTIVKIDKKTTEKGNAMFYIDVKSLSEKDNGDTESVVYPMKVWRSKEATKCESLNVGDFIATRVIVGAYVNKAGYNNLTLDVVMLTVQANAVPQSETVEAIQQEAEKAFGGESDQALPF